MKPTVWPVRGGRDEPLYPARLEESSFSGRMFSARRLGSRQHYRMVRCGRCGLVRSSPILDPSRIDELYTESDFLYSDEAPFAAETYLRLFQNLCRRHLDRAGVDYLVEVG